MARLVADHQVRQLLPVAEAIDAVDDLFVRGPLVQELPGAPPPGTSSDRPVPSTGSPTRPRAGGSESVPTLLGRSAQRDARPTGQTETRDPGAVEIGAMRSYISGEAGVRGCVLLYSTGTGELLAVLEADWLRQLGAAATAGLATRHLARADGAVVGLFGSGEQAEAQLLAMSAVRDVSLIKVFSRDRDRLQGFCSRMSLCVRAEVVPMAHAEAVVDGSDILITATRSAEALFAGSTLSAGVHVNAIGANAANRRELDAVAIGRAHLIVVDSMEAARKSAGDLLFAEREGVDPWSNTVELGAILRGTHPGRSQFEDITIFKPLGIPLADLTLAARAFELAERAEVGQEIQTP